MNNQKLYVVESNSDAHEGMSLWGLGATPESALLDAGVYATANTAVREVTDEHERSEMWRSFPHSLE